MECPQLAPSPCRLAGGPFVSARRLSQCLAVAGAEIEVFGIEDACMGEDLPLGAPLRPVAFPRSFLAAFGYARGLGGALVGSRADLIHIHGIWTYPSLAALRWFERVGEPRVVAPRGMLEPWAWRHHWWRKRPVWSAWERRSLRTASAIHATANDAAGNLRSLGLANPIAVMPNGVGFPVRLGKASGDGLRTALFVSRIHPKRGLLGTGLGAGSSGTKYVGVGVEFRGCQEVGASRLAAELGVIGRFCAVHVGWVLWGRMLAMVRAPVRAGAQGLDVHEALLAATATNGASFVVSGQVFGDPFAGLFFCLFLGAMLAGDARRSAVSSLSPRPYRGLRPVPRSPVLPTTLPPLGIGSGTASPSTTYSGRR